MRLQGPDAETAGHEPRTAVAISQQIRVSGLQRERTAGDNQKQD